MDPDHLLQLAADLAEINPRRPRRADLCRAVSTTYYAMFHCLAHTCADRLAGRAGTVGNRPMWRRAYRAPVAPATINAFRRRHGSSCPWRPAGAADEVEALRPDVYRYSARQAASDGIPLLFCKAHNRFRGDDRE